MKRLNIILFLFLLTPVFCAGQYHVTIEEAYTLIERYPRIQIVDIRTPEEFKTGHLKKAINITFGNPEFSTTASVLKKRRPVLLYDHAGNSSLEAVQVLLHTGRTKKDIYNMIGGITVWQQKYPIITD